MGSTSNALDKGGDNFKKLYNASDVTKRNRNGQTSLDLYLCSSLWNGTTKDSLMLTEYLSSTTPRQKSSAHGELIDIGVIEHWQNEADGLKMIKML